MCDNETYDALSLWKVFDQTFFPKPLGRNFSEFARALEEFVEGDQKEWGGLISPRVFTDVRVFFPERGAPPGRLGTTEVFGASVLVSAGVPETWLEACAWQVASRPP